MKKYLIIIAAILLGTATLVYAAPQYIYQKTILPEGSIYDIGSSTQAWRGIFGQYFTATSTNTASIFPYASTTVLSNSGNFYVNGSTFFVDAVNNLVGISTSTPFAKLSMTNTGTGPTAVFEDTTSPDSSPFAIDANGNVGVGSLTPSTKLAVYGSSSNTSITTTVDPTINIINTDTTVNNYESLLFRTLDTNGAEANVAKIAGVNLNHTPSGVSGNMSFLTTNAGSLAIKMTLDEAGELGIGVTSPLAALHIATSSLVATTTMFISNTAASTAGNVSRLGFGTWSGATPVGIYNASISAINTNTGTAASDLVFETYSGSGGVAGIKEKMRITSTGIVTIASTSPSSNFGFVVGSTGAYIGGRTHTGGLTATSTVFFNALTTAAGTPNSVCMNAVTKEITENAALTCTVSDEDQKNSIKPLEISALDTIRKIQPISFYYNDNPNRMRYGFGAQSLQNVDTQLADGYDKDGIARSIDLPALISLNTAAIKELDAKAGGLYRSAEENWQWLIIILLAVGMGYQQYQIRKIKNETH